MADNTSIISKYPHIGTMSNLEIQSLVSEVNEFLKCSSEAPNKAEVVGLLQNFGYERKIADDMFSFLCDLGAFEMNQYNAVFISEDYTNAVTLEEEQDMIKCLYILKDILNKHNVTFEKAVKYLRNKGYDESKAQSYLRYAEENGVKEGTACIWLEEGKDGFLRVLGSKSEENGKIRDINLNITQGF